MNLTANVFELITHSTEETQELGRHIGELAQPGDIILLTGNLGAGKTCFTQGVARGLGIEDYVMSPSFVIVRELHGRLPLYHIDLYRLDRIEETMDLGLDEYFYGEGVSVVEWAERAMSILPKKYLLIEIRYAGDNERRFRLKPSGQRFEELVAQLMKGYR